MANTAQNLQKYLNTHWLRTFTCVDASALINALESDHPIPIYCYLHYDNTNRLDNYLPVLFAKSLQQSLQISIVIQISGEDKQTTYARIAAAGIDPDRLFVFHEYDQITRMYPTICEIQKATPIANLHSGAHDQIYEYTRRITYAAPCFSAALPGIVPRGAHCIHITRDVFTCNLNPQIGNKPTIFTYSMLPPLQGRHGTTHINIEDTLEKCAENIRKLAFSGGCDTLAEHKKYGADISVDISIIYLQALMPDHDLLANIISDYGAGIITTSCVKDYLISTLAEYLPIAAVDPPAIILESRLLQ